MCKESREDPLTPVSFCSPSHSCVSRVPAKAIATSSRGARAACQALRSGLFRDVDVAKGVPELKNLGNRPGGGGSSARKWGNSHRASLFNSQRGDNSSSSTSLVSPSAGPTASSSNMLAAMTAAEAAFELKYLQYKVAHFLESLESHVPPLPPAQ